MTGIAGLAVARLRGIPFVFEVRDLWPESIVAVGALPAGHGVVRALEKVADLLYRQSTAVVAVTDTFRELLVERGLDPRNIFVVKNGVDLTRFQPMDRNTALRRRLEFGDRFVVAYIGTHGMAHALGSVLDVAARFKDRDDFRFLFAGEGAERKSLEARATAEGLGNVTFLGSVDRDAVSEVYATADVCLVPLKKTELFTSVIPSKIFEIFAMNRPLVISVDGEARRIVETSGGGVFTPPEDVDAMTRAIETMAKDRDSLAKMAARGRSYVVSNFDRDAIAAHYLDVLRRVATTEKPLSTRA
jgi:glycosyltransferase involved in cell wall biosynthesis